jgi:hypothetical protein
MPLALTDPQLRHVMTVAQTLAVARVRPKATLHRSAMTLANRYSGRQTD